MPVEANGLTSTKGRAVPIGPDGTVAGKDSGAIELLEALLLEMRAVRLILAEAFDVDVDPEELEI